VPLQHLKDITNNFCDERQIGRGGFGVVYKVRRTIFFPKYKPCLIQKPLSVLTRDFKQGVLGNGNVIAVKKFLQSIMWSSEKQFENEINLLRQLEHRNIVRLLGFCYETKHVQKLHEGKFILVWNIECLICLEYLSKGSLNMYISGMLFKY
jgi:serine/threonine protein kinase